MFLRRFLLASMAMCSLTAVGALAQSTTSSTTTRTISFPLIGLGSTQTAQVNVVNLATASSSGTAASCTGTIAFLNASGSTIGTASSFTVTSGQMYSATLPFSKSGAAGSHGVVRGVVTVTPASGVPCELESALEVYDTNTGVDASVTSQTMSTGNGGANPGR